MKKLRMILVFALVVAMLTACGGAPAETTAPVTEAPTTVPTTVPTVPTTKAAVSKLWFFAFALLMRRICAGGKAEMMCKRCVCAALTARAALADIDAMVNRQGE